MRLAVDALTHDKGEGVHDARKCIKRVRALLRLSRPWLEETTSLREGRKLRDAGRLLGSLRDREVLRETLERVADKLHFSGEIDFGKAVKLKGTEKADAIALLRRVDPRSWQGKGKGAKRLEEGVEKIHRDARKRFRTIERNRSDEALHDCRKRVKDLLYCLETLRPADPVRFDGWIGPLDKLADCLGDDHDLVVLEEHLEIGPDGEGQAIAGRIAVRRAVLQAKALRSGRAIFGKKPGDFAGKVRKSWEDWRG